MKKKIAIGIVMVIILGVGIFGYNSYKSYEDFNSLRSLLYEGYIPESKEFAVFLEEYSGFNNNFDLTDWQVEKGFDMNLELNRKFEDIEITVASENVKNEDAKKLKENVLYAIDTIQIILNGTYDSEHIDDLAIHIETLSIYIEEMNGILNDN